MFLRIFLIFLLNISMAYASNAQSGVIPNGFKEGYYSLGAEATYISTSTNYTDRGTSLDIDSPYAFSTIQNLVYGRYDFSDQTSVFFDLPLNYAASENLVDEYSSFRAAGLAIGLNYDFQLYSVTVIPQFKGYLTFEKFDRTAEEVLTSDGANYIEVGSHIFKISLHFNFMDIWLINIEWTDSPGYSTTKQMLLIDWNRHQYLWV